jgi:threonine synthase
VIAVQGDFDDALRLTRELVERRPLALLNSVNPHRLEGQKTAAFEVLEQLGGVPDWVALPVGNGGNITAYWRGFGESGAAPRMLAGQAEGAAPLVTGRPVERPRTVATAIRIGNPARLDEALAVVRDSSGAVRAMPDDLILTAYRLLAQEEGVFCEPASATSVAALMDAAADGEVAPGSTVVCVLTGHGLKDPDVAGQEGAEIVRCPPDVDRLEELALQGEPVRA